MLVDLGEGAVLGFREDPGDEESCSNQENGVKEKQEGETGDGEEARISLTSWGQVVSS